MGSGYERKGEWVTRGDFRAECLTCGWSCQKANAIGVGAQHARRLKHCVRIEVERAVIYNHEP